MNGLIALSLSYLLGQTAPSTEPMSTEPTQAQADSAVQAAELEELRAGMELLELQAAQRDQQAQARLSTLEEERASELALRQQTEQLRQQLLLELEQGRRWLLTLDRIIEAGQDDIGPAVASAQRDLGAALASATDIGRGESARQLESVLQRLGTLEGDIAQRNPSIARRQLLYAYDELNSAYLQSVDPAAWPAVVTPRSGE